MRERYNLESFHTQYGELENLSLLEMVFPVKLKWADINDLKDMKLIELWKICVCTSIANIELYIFNERDFLHIY